MCRAKTLTVCEFALCSALFSGAQGLLRTTILYYSILHYIICVHCYYYYYCYYHSLSLSIYIYIYTSLSLWPEVYQFFESDTLFLNKGVFIFVVFGRLAISRIEGCLNSTPDLPTNIVPTNIAWLKLSGKSTMGLGIPPLRIKIMLESNPLKPTMLVGRLGVDSSNNYCYRYS